MSSLVVNLKSYKKNKVRDDLARMANDKSLSCDLSILLSKLVESIDKNNWKKQK